MVWIPITCRKQLRDFFKTTDLNETIMQILDTFMSTKGPHHWLGYLIPEDSRLQTPATASNSDTTVFSYVTEFDQLMAEIKAVLTRYAYEVTVTSILLITFSSLLKD